MLFQDSDSENHTALDNEDFRQNGASWTWAFEIGSDPQVCPIVVEDLEYQGHMLIKVLIYYLFTLFSETASAQSNTRYHHLLDAMQ